MGLRNVHEVLAVRGEVNRVVEGRIGEAAVFLAIKAHAVQLQFHRIVTAARRVIKQSGFFVHALDSANFKSMIGKLCDETAAEIIQVEIFPTRPLGSPDEPLSVLQKAHGRRIVNPARRPFFPDNDAALARTWIRRAKLENVLPAIRAVEEQFFAIR